MDQGTVRFGKSILVLLIAGTLTGQVPPPRRGPGPPGGPLPPGGPEGVRRKLDEVRSTGKTTDRILGLARGYLERSTHMHDSSFAASRYLEAADALVHAAEHQQHIAQKAGPAPLDTIELDRHLERAYFRLQQADFFAKQSGDSNAGALTSFAREYYERALRASDIPDLRVADECAKSTEDVVRALENLALATAPTPVPGGSR